MIAGRHGSFLGKYSAEWERLDCSMENRSEKRIQNNELGVSDALDGLAWNVGLGKGVTWPFNRHQFLEPICRPGGMGCRNKEHAGVGLDQRQPVDDVGGVLGGRF